MDEPHHTSSSESPPAASAEIFCQPLREKQLAAPAQQAGRLPVAGAPSEPRTLDLKAIYQTAPFGLLVLDRQCRAVKLNRRMRRMLHAVAEDAADKSSGTLPSHLAEQIGPLVACVFSSGKPLREHEIAASGACWQVSLWPLRGAGRTVEAVSLVAQNIRRRKCTDHRLRDSEQHLRDAVIDAPIPVIIYDEKGSIIEISRVLLRWSGYRRRELRWLRQWLELAHGAQADEIENAWLACFQSPRRPAARDYRVTTRSGRQRVWSFSATAPGRMADGRRFITVMAIDVTERQRAEELLRGLNDHLAQRIVEGNVELERQTSRLHLLVGELGQAEQRERQRIAQLLHDDLQQYLVAAKLKLRRLQRPAAQADVPATADEVRALLDECLRIARGLSVELRPNEQLAQGLGPALQWLAQWFQRTHGLRIELEVAGLCEPEDERIRTCLFDSVRELLLNTAKHAGVDQASIRLGNGPDERIALIVSDEGRGFAPETELDVGATRGSGLRGLRDRLEALGGGLRIQSAEGCGTRIHLYAPRRLSAGPRTDLAE